MSTHSDRVPVDPEKVVEKVKDRYGRIAQRGATGCCAPSDCCSAADVESVDSTKIGYDPSDLDAVPDGADLGLGCGAPIGHLALRPGETVLDLGSGAGFDAFLAARAVGESGKVIGVDMTPEMLGRARGNAARAGIDNVEFREGRIEALPVEDATVDAVTSNCVINLVPDKSRAFREVARVLRPGGRVVISDIVLDGDLPDALRDDLLAYVGCVAGALRRARYFAAVEDAGLTDVQVLRDVDFLSLAAEAAKDQALEFVSTRGVRMDDLAGVVRSVTFRATKR
jgi:SAM-dependent methyltransferase